MRRTFNPQLELGATPIERIRFNPRSRDDIPQLLRGLQHIYTDASLRDAVLEVLEKDLSRGVNFNNGRPGMDLWVLLVLGVLRLGLGCDYDRLHELVNEHKTLRAMLGHGGWGDTHCYALQTLKDNVVLLNEKTLMAINARVVKAGHELIKKKEDEPLRGRCDSFVVETHVEYPTDSGLLFDALRKAIALTARLCQEHGISGWRQWNYGIDRLKVQCRRAQSSHRSRKADARQEQVKAYKSYLGLVSDYYEKCLASVVELEVLSGQLEPQDWNRLQDQLEKLGVFQDYVEKLADQVQRRLLDGERISADEKIYSIFQPHTEWISKGKAGVPFELGLKVCVLEDQHQFILHHQVMENVEDVGVAVSMIAAARAEFPLLKACSFDKGFHSPTNQTNLAVHLEEVILPKKGRLSAQRKETEQAQVFKRARRQHSAVESAINGLEQNGLDRCRDHGIAGFKRYVALGILSRNLQRIGTLLTNQERAALKLKRKHCRGPCAQAA